VQYTLPSIALNDGVVGVVAFLDSNNSDSACGEQCLSRCIHAESSFSTQFLQHSPTDEETMMRMTAETITRATVTMTAITAVQQQHQ